MVLSFTFITAFLEGQEGQYWSNVFAFDGLRTLSGSVLFLHKEGAPSQYVRGCVKIKNILHGSLCFLMAYA